MNLCQCGCGKEVYYKYAKYIRGHNGSWNKGLKTSDKTLKKQSEAKLKDKNPMYGRKRPNHSLRMIGENNPNYKGGISKRDRSTDRYKQYHKNVLKRDNYRCKDCNVKIRDLHVHHIFKVVDFPHIQYEEWNGITLCKKCHFKTFGKEDSYILLFLKKINVDGVIF